MATWGIRIGKFNYSNVLCGNYRYLERIPCLPASRPDLAVHRRGFSFPLSLVWISRAATREISGLVVSGDEDDVRRRRNQHVPMALPSGNYGKPRLSKEAILDGLCTPGALSLSLSLSLFLSLSFSLGFLCPFHPRVVFFRPPFASSFPPFFLCSILSLLLDVNCWEQSLRNSSISAGRRLTCLP